MNTWHLKYFIEAARNQSVQSAAQKYFVTPSAISQAIRTLETELGTPLLVHQKRMFSLTPAGTLFLEKAALLIGEIEQLPDYLKSTEKDPQGLIRIAAPRSLFTDDLAQRIVNVQKIHPKLKFQIRGSIAADIKKLVRDGEADFGLLIDDYQTEEFSEKLMSSGTFVLFSAITKKNKNLDSLIVTNPEKIEVVHLFKELKKKKMPIPNIPIEILSWSMIRSLVFESDHVGYVPDYIIAQDIKEKRLKIFDPGTKAFQYDKKIIWAKGKPMPFGAKLLLGL